MHPQIPSYHDAHSSAIDRRLNSLLKHLEPSSSSSHSVPAMDSLSASPTSAFQANSVFSHVDQAPEDPILGVTVAYNKDPSPMKLNLGVGAYRTEVI